MRELKEQQFGREKQWKVQLEQLRCEKKRVEELAEELQSDLASVRAQNSLFSEWMLVRSENALMAQRGDPQHRDRVGERQQREAASSRRQQQDQLEEDNRRNYRRCQGRHHEDDYGDVELRATKVEPSPVVTFADDNDGSSSNNDAEVSGVERTREQYSAANRLYVQTASASSPGGLRSPPATRKEVRCRLLLSAAAWLVHAHSHTDVCLYTRIP